MTKFFFITALATFGFWTAFNPMSGLNPRPLKNYPKGLTSWAEDGSYYMGAD